MRVKCSLKKTEVTLLRQQLAKKPKLAPKEEKTQEEQFSLVETLREMKDKKFAIRTDKGTYVASRGKDGMLYTDSKEIGKEELFSIVPLVAIKGQNGHFLTATQDGKGPLAMTKNPLYQFETYELILKEDNQVHIHSHYSKHMVTVDKNTHKLKCAQVNPGPAETFKILDL